MRSILTYITLLTFLIAGAQDEAPRTDDLEDVSDDFQEHFFEALKHRAIENYDRALQALEKAAAERPDEAVVYFEMAKNHTAMGQYGRAEANYQKTVQMAGERPEILFGLYDVYAHTQNYTAAIETVKKMIPYDRDFKQDLANLYARTQQYEAALQILDELDSAYGHDEYRNGLRQQIYKDSGIDNPEAGAAGQAIEESPEAYREQGDVHMEKKEYMRALERYEEGLSLFPGDFHLVRSALPVMVELEQYEKAEKRSAEALDMFPTQPVLYYWSGVARTALQNPAGAIEMLETGLDFLIDDRELERDFYRQLARAYRAAGDAEKAAEYEKKAQ